MEEIRKGAGSRTGRFLRPAGRRSSAGRWLGAAALLAWDGVLLYMIAEQLIQPVYGAAFVAVGSVYMGYQI